MSDLDSVYEEAVLLRDALQQDINLATTRIEHIRTSALANQAAHLVKKLDMLRDSGQVIDPTHPLLFAETLSIH
jgi:hypothetical protein